MKSTVGLAAFLLVCLAAGGLGSLATPPNIPWYETLSRPPWTPPNWLFAPVWTALYLLMAVAGWLVWRAGGWAGAPTALGLFAGQLLLNVVWSWLFFGYHAIGLALIEMGLLWLAIGATLIAFSRVRLSAALLLAPYFVWVTFAITLNAALWQMNR